MTNKQKSVIEYLDEVYYKENEGKKGNLITKVKEAQEELNSKEGMANLTEDEQRNLEESAGLLRNESTDSIGLLGIIGSLFMAVLAMCMSSISLTISGAQLVWSGASCFLSLLAFALALYTSVSLMKNAKRADRYRSIILALLLPKDDEPQIESVETKQDESNRRCLSC